MQEYIEANLERPITMQVLARQAAYSVFHAARIFKEITGISPFDYIRKRRLSVAAERLDAGEVRVIDVAFDFVFDSHEGFTRAFSRQFGVPPTKLKQINWSAFQYHPELATAYYWRRQKGLKTMTQKKDATSQDKKKDVVFVQILERPARKLIYKPGKSATHYYEYCEEVGCDVWETLSQITPTLHEPMGLWWPTSMRPLGCSEYAQGVEVSTDYDGPVPLGFEVMELAPCAVLVFQGPAFDDRDFEAAIESLWDIMSDYDPSIIGYEWAKDDGPRFQLAPMGYRGYIEGKPVRKRNG
ncbi:MAG: AraC family transcriptional regulator [Deltaproteobacteria bacterium]|nr:AraC family transcriptional regulator [Deltaproteobacteria bacterium]